MNDLHSPTFTMESVEEADRRRLPLQQIEIIHLVSTALSCWLANMVVWSSSGTMGQAVAAGIGLLCLIALRLGQAVRPLLQDFYKQFHYREKFALFLFHVLVFLFVWIISFQFILPLMLASLLVFLCLQGINSVFFGRIHALTTLMVVMGCMDVVSPPVASIVMLYFVAILSALRFGHIRWRVEKYGTGHGVELRDLLMRTISIVMIPPLIGWGAYLISVKFLNPRHLVFDRGAISNDGSTGFVSISSLIFDAFMICLIIGVVAVLLNWLDKKLRKKGKAAPVDLDGIATNEQRRKINPDEIGDLEVVQSQGPRERIIGAFRSFSARAADFGFGRPESETAAHWMEHLPPIDNKGEVHPLPFEKACYSESDISEEEANSFVEGLDSWLNAFKEKLKSEQESEGTECSDTD